jgi:hypothetical protein
VDETAHTAREEGSQWQGVGKQHEAGEKVNTDNGTRKTRRDAITATADQHTHWPRGSERKGHSTPIWFRHEELIGTPVGDRCW